MTRPLTALLADLDAACSTPDDVAAVLAWALARMVRGGEEPRRGRNLTVKELAERLRVGPDWVYKNPHARPMAIRVGRRLMFPERAVERWEEAREGRG